MNDKTSRAAALLFARALLGIIFLMQGYGKIFTYTVPKVYGMFFKDFEKTFLPKWLIWGTAYYTSYVELICGFLLIIGFSANMLYTCWVLICWWFPSVMACWNRSGTCST